jgi:glyoxylate/hydroxypyruvate reductase A
LPRLLFLCPGVDPGRWRRGFARHMPELEFVPATAGEAETPPCDYALVWRPPAGALQDVPDLRAVFSLGAGVDDLLRRVRLPAGVPLVRLVDPALTELMVEYVVHWVIHHHRDFARYAAWQREERWRQVWPGQTSERRVGIMGLGELGGAAARAVAALGFDTAGWSRTPRRIPGVRSFHGPGELPSFLARTDILVCLLPLTAGTERLLDARALGLLPEGARLVNAGRGGVLVEEDLLDALESGRIAAATLDVFREEPLPPGHPFWRHPRVQVTPHVASLTNADTATAAIVANIRRLESGEALTHVVDVERGY